ncbi:hypothetical protein PLA107_013890 [Pseudomonas amygdali pv. lachrymans str. M301315]|uniref:Uncharacterized protein n=1 Tax=Pseudomonas amygdali pv. lachrymans str. M301315 TaxID=629260 RepID=A0AAD0PTC4_PSEAV|nr:hypothetical protein B5U27_09230 [Pseudomonas amygdali pv. lachrymans]AXH56278.1 hypothetical protein PLA107_013890 [Pseudomonas amygdali pv. lachrymans str. M301315]PWD04112.1 hypothetical protein CX658_03925 [Pseudomonas amygdali pv. lachrymans]
MHPAGHERGDHGSGSEQGQDSRKPEISTGHLPPPKPRTSPTEPSPVPVWPLSVLECSVEGVQLLRIE